jgi:hypothetical protein
MLSQTERERLINRNEDDMDAQVRASNDLRIKKKLSLWLEEDLEDIRLCLRYMPNDRLKKMIKEEHIFALLGLVEELLAIKEFHSIYGDFRDPANWGITDACGESRGWRSDYKSLKKASDLDIWRSVLLNDHISALRGFLGSNNPVQKFASTVQFSSDDRFKEYIQPGDVAGMERIRQALKDAPIQPRLDKIDVDSMAVVTCPKAERVT